MKYALVAGLSVLVAACSHAPSRSDTGTTTRNPSAAGVAGGPSEVLSRLVGNYYRLLSTPLQGDTARSFRKEGHRDPETREGCLANPGTNSPGWLIINYRWQDGVCYQDEADGIFAISRDSKTSVTSVSLPGPNMDIYFDRGMLGVGDDGKIRVVDDQRSPEAVAACSVIVEPLDDHTVQFTAPVESRRAHRDLCEGRHAGSDLVGLKGIRR